MYRIKQYVCYTVPPRIYFNRQKFRKTSVPIISSRAFITTLDLKKQKRQCYQPERKRVALNAQTRARLHRHAHTHICIHVFMHACVCMHIYIDIYILYTHVYKIWSHTHTHICVYIYIYIMYVCECVCGWVGVCATRLIKFWNIYMCTVQLCVLYTFQYPEDYDSLLFSFNVRSIRCSKSQIRTALRYWKRLLKLKQNIT